MSGQGYPVRVDSGGGPDPGAGARSMAAADNVGTGPATGTAPGTSPGSDPGIEHRPLAPPSRPWSAGRVVAVVAGCLLAVIGAGMVVGGAVLGVAAHTARDDAGFVMTGEQAFATTTYAVASTSLETRIGDGAEFVPDHLLGRVKLSVTPTTSRPVFVGVGPTAQVRDYLAGVAHATLVDIDGNGIRLGDGTPTYRFVRGGAPATMPGRAPVDWAASATGTGRQQVLWAARDGDWTVVVMNADAAPDVAFAAAVGAELPALAWVVVVLVVVGVLAGTTGAVVLARALRTEPR